MQRACVLLALCAGVSSYTVGCSTYRPATARSHLRCVADEGVPANVAKMRLAAVKAELDERGVEWRGVCFEKEQLVAKLIEARASPLAPDPDPPAPPQCPAPAADVAEASPSGAAADVSARTEAVDTAAYDEAYAAAFERASGLRVKEIRAELAGRRIGWADLIEKHELAARLATACAEAAMFSPSGAVSPGTASEVSGEQLAQEMADGRTPLLVDVYATWCGPCKLVAPQVQALAETYGSRLRVAKLDSDEHSQMATQLSVQGLPTLVFFRGGSEVFRLEGVPSTKGALEALARQHLQL